VCAMVHVSFCVCAVVLVLWQLNLLIEHNADLNIRANDGQTVISHSTTCRRPLLAASSSCACADLATPAAPPLREGTEPLADRAARQQVRLS
jgi:hypothetical protein